MRIGIICASERELTPFFEDFQESSILEKAMITIHIGKVDAHDVYLLYCGVCKVNSAIATQLLIDNLPVDMIINSGVAGGMDERVRIFDTVISTEIAYHDVAEDILTEYHPWMKSVFFAADEKLLSLSMKVVKGIDTKGTVYFGRMVTGEAFIADEGRRKILDEFSPLSVDMETGSIAHVCYVNKVPFIAVRSITDTADHSGSVFFEKNCEIASKIAKDITMAIIQGL